MNAQTKRLYLVKLSNNEWAASWETSLSSYKGFLNRNFKDPKINWGSLLIGKCAEEKSLELKIDLKVDVNLVVNKDS
jgi:hypothetical protein